MLTFIHIHNFKATKDNAYFFSAVTWEVNMVPIGRTIIMLPTIATMVFIDIKYQDYFSLRSLCKDQLPSLFLRWII